MTNTTFLDKIAKTIIDNYDHKLSDLVVVLPNKRAKVFLIEAMKNATDKTVFAPQIISIEDFVQEIANIRSIDSIELVFEFYEVYLEITAKEKQQTFELFANWGKTLLQDFNEIDRYLLEPNHILSYLKDIEDIKHWSLDAEKRTKMIDSYLQFWDLLPKYYESLYNHLLNKGIGYQGLIYREAVKNLDPFSNSICTTEYLFAGFNATNASD